MLKTTIIIVTYNRIKWIDKCLRGCKDYKNASTDGTVKDYFPKINLIEQANNLGFEQTVGTNEVLKDGGDFIVPLFRCRNDG